MRWPIVTCLFLSACLTHQRDDDAPPDDPPPPEHPQPSGAKRMFVSRGLYTGALAIDDLHGIDAADQICKLRAKAAGLGGTWIAWLSTSNVDAIERITSLGPWQLVGGAVAFDNRAQLYGEPLTAIDRDERGDEIQDPMIWTGTTRGGLRSTDTCGDWQVPTARGWFGWRSTTFAWTDYTAAWCGEQKHLLCFEL